jgi:hypothetical protein
MKLTPELWQQLTNPTSYALEVVDAEFVAIGSETAVIVLLIRHHDPQLKIEPFHLLLRINDLDLLQRLLINGGDIAHHLTLRTSEEES